MECPSEPERGERKRETFSHPQDEKSRGVPFVLHDDRERERER